MSSSFFSNIFIIHTKPLDISRLISKQTDSSLNLGDSCENELPDCLKVSCYYSFQLVRMSSQVLLFSISGPWYFQFFRFLLFSHNDSLLISPDLLLPKCSQFQFLTHDFLTVSELYFSCNGSLIKFLRENRLHHPHAHTELSRRTTQSSSTQQQQ